MGHGKGKLRQNFLIRLDMSKFMSYIEEKIRKAIESEKDIHGNAIFKEVSIDECFFEDDEFHVRGAYDTAFEWWYSPATRECPEEDLIEHEYIGEHGNWVLCDLPDELKNLISVYKVIEDEEDAGIYEDD